MFSGMISSGIASCGVASYGIPSCGVLCSVVILLGCLLWDASYGMPCNGMCFRMGCEAFWGKGRERAELECNA